MTSLHSITNMCSISALLRRAPLAVPPHSMWRSRFSRTRMLSSGSMMGPRGIMSMCIVPVLRLRATPLAGLHSSKARRRRFVRTHLCSSRRMTSVRDIMSPCISTALRLRATLCARLGSTRTRCRFSRIQLRSSCPLWST